MTGVSAAGVPAGNLVAASAVPCLSMDGVDLKEPIVPSVFKALLGVPGAESVPRVDIPVAL